MAGKITDENNKPVPGAEIKLLDQHKVITAKTDSDGLYFTRKLQPGNYRVIIEINGRRSVADKLITPPDVKDDKFYNFCLHGSKAIEETTDKDPFIAAKFDKMNADKDPRHTVDGNGRILIRELNGLQDTIDKNKQAK